MDEFLFIDSYDTYNELLRFHYNKPWNKSQESTTFPSICYPKLFFDLVLDSEVISYNQTNTDDRICQPYMTVILRSKKEL